MSKVFLDTNILVYSLDQSDSGKREKCRGLIKSLTGENSGVISTQVMQEFYVAATPKLGADPVLIKDETPRALETEEIPLIVEDYRMAAERAKGAGFDGIEIHGANGYLIDQFLQSRTNHRSDRYGGSIENRFRFLDEVVRAVIAVWPAGRVGVHLSPNGIFNDMGSPDFRETFLHAATQLSRYRLGYLHVVDGLALGFHQLGAPMTLAEFRTVFSGPLIGNCGYTRETAEDAIRSHHADLISFGRPYISNPDLVERFAHDWP